MAMRRSDRPTAIFKKTPSTPFSFEGYSSRDYIAGRDEGPQPTARGRTISRFEASRYRRLFDSPFRRLGTVIDHVHFHHLVSRYELVFVLVPAVVRWFEFVPEDVSVFIGITLIH